MAQSRLLLVVIASVGLFFAAGVDATESVEKVLICHRPPGNPDNSKTISVAQKTVAAHLKHGDQLGECPTGVTLVKIVVFGYRSRSGTSEFDVNPCLDPGDLPKGADQFGSYTDQDAGFLHPDGSFQTQVVAMGVFTDGSFHNMTESVNWTSSDPALATVSNVAGDKGRVVTVYTRNVAVSLLDRTVAIRADGPGLLGDDITFTIVDLFLETVVINRCNGCDPSGAAEPDPLNLLLGSTERLQLHGRFGATEGTLTSDDNFFCVSEDATWASNSPVVSVLDSAGSRGTVTGEDIGSAVIAAQIGVTSDVIVVEVSGAAIQ